MSEPKMTLNNFDENLPEIRVDKVNTVFNINNIYFRLRFGLINSINTYLSLSIRVM